MGLGVLKYDLANHTEAGYFAYGDLHGGEALFVPKANAGSEDDGYLLDLLMGDDDAALVVIDASTMEEVARLHLPQRVPFGVHARWLDIDKLENLDRRLQTERPAM
jgi:carotenoid cleavage dioxygenase